MLIYEGFAVGLFQTEMVVYESAGIGWLLGFDIMDFIGTLLQKFGASLICYITRSCLSANVLALFWQLLICICTCILLQQSGAYCSSFAAQIPLAICYSALRIL